MGPTTELAGSAARRWAKRGRSWQLITEPGWLRHLLHHAIQDTARCTGLLIRRRILADRQRHRDLHALCRRYHYRRGVHAGHKAELTGLKYPLTGGIGEHYGALRHVDMQTVLRRAPAWRRYTAAIVL